MHTRPRTGCVCACVTLLALAFAFAFASCAGSSSPSGDAKKKEQVILSSPEVDVKVGREEAKKVGGAMGLLDDPALTAYVDEIGQRLARHAPRRRFSYQFQIVDQDAPNAFALPGGFIYISRGLLILSNSEEELANVIGHEIIHVAARHAAARQSVVGALGPMAAFAAGSIASYSRDQERESDRLGQGLAALAGYDPDGLALFLRDLEYTERLQLGGSRLPGFFDTHPATTERVAAAGARSRVVEWTPKPTISENHADYLRRLEGLIVGTAAAEGVFDGERFLHADLDFTIRFPAGWKTMNTRQAVGAFSPRRDAQVYLEHQGPGTDPRLASQKFIQKAQKDGVRLKLEKVQPLKIGPYPAYQIQGRIVMRGGSGSVMMTWIARDGGIYCITAAGSAPAFNRYKGSFRNVARSFRPLPPNYRRNIRENHLRIVQAKAGESLSALGQRTNNQWDIQTTAVMNGIFADARLEAGHLVKIAVSRAYAPVAAR